MKQFIGMIGNEIVLDTNIVIALFKGDVTILENLNKIQSVHIPSIVLGELLLEAYRSSDSQKHLLQINSFLQTDKHFSEIENLSVQSW